MCVDKYLLEPKKKKKKDVYVNAVSIFENPVKGMRKKQYRRRLFNYSLCIFALFG